MVFDPMFFLFAIPGLLLGIYAQTKLSSTYSRYVRQGLATLPEMSDAESDRLDMGFDVRPYSRLGCQVKVADKDLTIELTEESIKTWYDEHPEARKQ